MLYTKTLVKQELSSQFFKYQTKKKKKHKLTIDVLIFIFSGNSYKFKVGSKANALLWYRYLQGAAKTRLEYKVSHCELLMIYLVSLCSVIVRERTETRGVCWVFLFFSFFVLLVVNQSAFVTFRFHRIWSPSRKVKRFKANKAYQSTLRRSTKDQRIVSEFFLLNNSNQ